MQAASALSEEEDRPEQLGWMFEGSPVQSSRVTPGSPGEFACVDEDGSPLELRQGDVLAYQAEVVIESVNFPATYKGGIQVKPIRRIHVAKVVEGSQVVIGYRRKP